MDYKSPFCAHILSVDLDATPNQIVSCPCGYQYRVRDLQEFARLNEQIESTKSKLAALVKSMAERSRNAQDGAESEPAVTVAYQTVSASTIPASAPPVAASGAPNFNQPPVAAPGTPNFKQPPVAAPKPPKAKRQRNPISAQQWLIIGAAVLVFVASSVFVSANIGSIPREGFLAITLGVSVATGFAAFRGRKFSVLLSNFMAAFSSAMLMMGMLVLGDLLFNFPWDRSTQTWWAITLAVVALQSASLAKLSANFGWKAISPLAFTFSGLLFTYGTVGTWLRDTVNGYPWQLLTLSLTIIALLYLLRFLKAIPHRTAEIEANKEYEADLERRETSALNKYAQFATALLGLFGIALTVTQTLHLFSSPIDPLASLALGVVWIFGAQTIDLWGGPLSKDGEVDARLRKLAWVLGFVNVGLGLVSFSSQIPSIWLGTFAALAVVALILASPALKWLKSDQFAINFGVWSSVAAWLVWSTASKSLWSLSGSDWLAVATFVLALSILLVLGDLVASQRRNQVLPMVVNGIGLVLLPLSFQQLMAEGSSPVLTLLILVASAIAFALVQILVGLKVGHEHKRTFEIIQLVAQSIGVFILLGNFDPSKTAESVYGIAALALGLTLAIRLAAAKWTPIASSAAAGYLRAESYLLQGIIALELLILWVGQGSTDVVAKLIIVAAATAAVNYVLALIEKDALLSFFGLAAASLAVLASWNPLSSQLVAGATFSLIIVALSVLSGLHVGLVGKRLEASRTNVYFTTLVSTFGASAIAGLTHIDKIAAFSNQDHAILQGTLSGLALVTAAAGFRGLKLGPLTVSPASDSLLARLLPAVYAAFGLVWSTATEWSGVAAGLTLALASYAANRAFREYVSLAGIYAGLLYAAIGASALTRDWFASTKGLENLANAPETTSIWFALAIVIATSLSGELLGHFKRYARLDIPVSVIALLSLAYANTIQMGVQSDENALRSLIALTALAALAYWRTLTLKNWFWLVASYVFGIVTAFQAVQSIAHFAKWQSTVPEWYSIAIALALAGSAAISGELLGAVKRFARLDIPITVAALISLWNAGVSAPLNDESYLRALFALAALVALSYWRTIGLKQWLPLIGSYLFGIIEAVHVVRTIDHFGKISLELSEVYAVAVAIAIAGASAISGELLGKAKRLMTFDVPILLGVTVSMAHALTHDPTQGANLLRALIDSAIYAAFGIWRATSSKSLIWFGLGYAGAIGLALSAGRELELALQFKEQTPEVYSILFAAAFFGMNLVLKRIREFETSLISWGLPLGALVVPSALATSATSAIVFNELTSTQVVRTLVTLVISLALFVVGVRRGNLGQTTVGVVGLALVAWIRTGSAEGTSLFEFRALVLAFVLFLGLAALRKYAHTGGNSLIYIGLPTAVALLPALYNALVALSQPSLTPVDWWRFAILLVASLALLIVGALREQAGMFFPGLIGVLSTALPYGFKGVSNQSWFLWVVLLLVAGIMVWIAVRLEQMRKVGKSSINWIKELK